MHDKELVKKIIAGDSRAFKALFEGQKEQVINICYRLVGNREEAEDLCQEVFFKVYKSIRTFKRRSRLSTWVYRIAINLSLNHIRKKKRAVWFGMNRSYDPGGEKMFDWMPAPAGEQPDLLFEEREREQIVWRAINSLPRNQRVALILQRYEGLSGQQIAEIMDCSLSSVQSRLHRAKSNLHDRLLPYLDHI